MGASLWAPVLAVTLLLCGAAEANAAYRLVFQNGTSVEVRSYEDLGASIRYPRLGGIVVVPKSSLSSIEEAVHLPPPTPPPSTTPKTIVLPAPTVPPVRYEQRPAPAPQSAPSPVPGLILAPTPSWKQVGNTAIASGTVRILTGVALLISVVAVVLFFTGGALERSGSEADDGVAGGWNSATPEYGRRVTARSAKPLGVVLVCIYDVVFGATGMLVGFAGAAMGEFLADLPFFLVPAEGPVAVILLSIAATVFGAVVLATAYGMWSLQAWGWRLQAIVCFVDILLEALGFLVSLSTAGSLFGAACLIIDSAILLYISRPWVRELYLNDVYEIRDSQMPMTEDEPHTPSL